MTTTCRTGPMYQLALACLLLTGRAAPARAAAVYTVIDLGLNRSFSNDFDASGAVVDRDPNSAFIRQQAGHYTIGYRWAPSNITQSTLSLDGGPPVELTSPGDNLPGALVHNEHVNVWAFAVNASGAVVGNYEPHGDSALMSLGTAFVYYGPETGLQAVPLPPTPRPYYGFLGSAAYSINDSGLIVGTVGNYYADDGLGSHAFLSDGRSSWDLNTLLAPGSGVGLTDAIDINAAGQIIARGKDAGGQYHDYLLTPAAAVPEPSTLALLAAGCLLGGGRRLAARRRG